ncbi:MAG: hypothetical protein WC813_04400 [Patescibacteria group bacterium]|jgi:hypothetical protein
MLTLILSLFVSSANAGDSVYVPRATLGSRPAVVSVCPDGVSVVGRIRAGTMLPYAELCADHQEAMASIATDRALVDGQVDVDRIDAVTRRQEVESDRTIGVIDANTRREVSLQGIEHGVATYARGDMVVTGDKPAAIAAEFDNLPAGGGYSFYDRRVGQSFTAFDTLNALDGNGGYSGGLVGQTTQSTSSTSATTATVNSTELQSDLQKADEQSASLRTQVGGLQGQVSVQEAELKAKQAEIDRLAPLADESWWPGY